MHLDIGQSAENVGRVLELDPVELDVLARGEMAVALVPASRRSWRAGASGATTACHREWRSAAYRRGAADRGRSSAARGGTRPRSARPSGGAWPGRGIARCARARTDGRTRHSDTWLSLPQTAERRRPGLRPACRDRARTGGTKRADALANVERADLAVLALGIEQIGAGDERRALIVLAARFRGPWRPAARVASTASSIASLQSPLRVRKTTAPSRRRLAVSTWPVSTGLALSIFLTGTVMMLSARSGRHSTPRPERARRRPTAALLSGRYR